MKLRTGFVSNSSSSSFLVVFDKKPQSKKELRQMMFPDNKENDSIEYCDRQLPINDIVERVYKDINSNKKATEKDIVDLYYSQLNFYISEYDHPYGSNGIPNNCTDTQTVNKITSLQNNYELQLQQVHQQKEDINLNETLSQILCSVMYNNKQLKLVQRILTDDTLKLAILHRLNTDRYIAECSNFKITNPKITFKDCSRYISLAKELTNISHDFYAIADKYRIKIAKNATQNFLKQHTGKFIAIFSYSDNSGESVLEHGEIFRNLTHTQFSQH